jgi:transcriptional regulator with XRE-family HTH domain
MATVKITTVAQWPEAPLCVGERLRGLRVERGLLQSTVADAVGLQPKTIGGFERSVYDPSWKNFTALAKFYGVSLDWLAGIE